MTKRFYIFMLLVLGWLGAEAKNEPYAALSEDNTTLTFYYDEYKNSRGGMDIGPFKSKTDRGWNDQRSTITTVVFDELFVGYTELTSTAYWFYECSVLTTITGIEHLNTANVTDMKAMFHTCESLTSLDVSNFNTAKVTNMSYMFDRCYKLTDLDVTHFNTSKVTNMDGMFAYCKALTSLDVSNFNTSNVTYMDEMFRGCIALTSLDVTNFNTDKVKIMRLMFSGCYGLTSLDVTNFNTAQVIDMSYMFRGCSSLTTIYCNGTWNCESSESMFDGCTSLVGAIAYDDSKADVTYANPETGYFTKYVFPYAALSDDNTTLTFYYDEYKKSRGGMDIGPFSEYGESEWFNKRDIITKVVFDESFANYTELTSTAYWFYNCREVTTVTGIEHLNTDKVTNMFYMFCNCSKLTNLDVTHFNTANVEDMGCMFFGCSSLTSLDLLDFNTAKVTNMSAMFYGCSSLKTIYCNDTWNCGFSTLMFTDCTSLVGAIAYDPDKKNVSYANPETGYFTKVDIYPYAVLSDDNTTLMFYYDKYKIRRAGMDVGPFSEYGEAEWFNKRDNITKVVFDESFAKCKTLTSTAYWFCNCRELTTVTGIEHLNTDNVTNMFYMFCNCSKLTNLDVTHFNTVNVEDMGCMFFGCSGLTSLDLVDFNTAKVTSMSGMFYGCSSLKAIYCNDTWNCESSETMFSGCTSLVGAIAYDSDKANVSYANPETGYFTKVEACPYAVLSNNNRTLTFYYDKLKIRRGGMDVGPFTDSGEAGWDDQRASIHMVAFDKSLADYEGLTSTAYWFSGCSALYVVSGMNYLKTANVTNMTCMFSECSSLKSLNVTSWKTAKVTDMSYLFYKCSVLGSINVSYFNTANVEDMSYMFYGCSDLTILDLKKFSTAKVKNMSDMFFNCSSLKAIDCHSAWKCDNSDDMFRGCTSLKGVIAYDDSKTDATYANPISGYFTGILLGDVNDDGTVDDKDIAAVIRYILEGDSEGFNFAKADMNGDGVINVADIVLINAIKEK